MSKSVNSVLLPELPCVKLFTFFLSSFMRRPFPLSHDTS
jgi:hypothetical protein